jgi:hypothetical protein
MGAYGLRSAPYAGRGFGYPQQYAGPRYVENIIEVPLPIPAPAVTSPAKTLAAVDMLLTMAMFGGSSKSIHPTNFQVVRV